MPNQAQTPNAFQTVRPRGKDCPSAAPPKKHQGMPPLMLPGSHKRVIDTMGRSRPAEQSAAMRAFAIESAEQSRASRDKRHALVKGGL